MLNFFEPASLKRRFVRHTNNLRIFLMAQRVARMAPAPQDARPIAFFKASSGLDDLSWNSAFHLLTSWGLRLQGIPVVFFACNHGMSRCVLGTNREDPSQTPPCHSCTYQSHALYTGANKHWFGFERNPELEKNLQGLNLDKLTRFSFQGIPLGELCLPGLRWILRRHNLVDDDATRFFFREYILSAFNIAQRFEEFLEQAQPQAIVLFNGQFFPEATAKWVAKQRGVRVVCHEVGLMPMTGFFTTGEATAYPIDIPDSFELNESQNGRLDEYLAKRFQGNFSMAGIQFWPNIKGLDEPFLLKAGQFKQIVPIFTNVIFDTSQPHANTVFTDMFAWLDLVLETARNHPETLFVIRAHPDETRAGKESQESVAGWVESRQATELPNIVFVPSTEYLSSYELIARSKFVLIYNSTIGLEASIMGAAVLSAGKARFTRYPSVFFPQSVSAYRAELEMFLAADHIPVPPGFKRNARRFLYYQLFRTSLPFGNYIDRGILPVNSCLKWFDPQELLPENSPALATITKGLLEDGDFLLEESAFQANGNTQASTSRHTPSLSTANLRHTLRQSFYQAEKLIHRARFAKLPEPKGGWPILLGISFPKSGTHLLDQVLIGFSDVAPFSRRLHSFYAQYDGETGRKHSKMETAAWLKSLRPLDVTSAHLFASPEAFDYVLTSAFIPFFIYRDPRDVAVSHVFYVTEMERSHVHHVYYQSLPDFESRLKASILGIPPTSLPRDVEFLDIAKRFEPYMGWLTQPQVLNIKYEDLIENRMVALNRIVDHFLIRVPLNIPRDAILSSIERSIDPRRSPTFRSGKTGEWQKYFGAEHRKLFKEVAGDLLIQLGYEKDYNW